MHIVVFLGILSIPVYFYHRHVERRYDYRPITLGRIALACYGGLGLGFGALALRSELPPEPGAVAIIVMLLGILPLLAIARLLQLHVRGTSVVTGLILTVTQTLLALALVFVAVGLWAARSTAAFNRNAQAAQAAGIGRGLEDLQNRLRHQDNRRRDAIVEQGRIDRIMARDQSDALSDDDKRLYDRGRNQA